MIFYKNMLVSVFLSVLIILTILGIIMYYGQNKQIFPASFPPCPDYYSSDTTGKCIANSSIWTFTNNLPTSLPLQKCSIVDFSGNYQPGVGPSSGLCTMKKWANDCNVTWDGITNNTSICYN